MLGYVLLKNRLRAAAGRRHFSGFENIEERLDTRRRNSRQIQGSISILMLSPHRNKSAAWQAEGEMTAKEK